MQTYPVFGLTELPVVAGDNVKDDQDPEDGVVGGQGVDGAELPIVHNVEPRGEDQDPGDTVQDHLQHQQGRWSSTR